MIKVLKEGNVFKVTCPNCESVLQYSKEDVICSEKQNISNPYRPFDIEEKIGCPVCGGNIIVSKQTREVGPMSDKEFMDAIKKASIQANINKMEDSNV